MVALVGLGGATLVRTLIWGTGGALMLALMYYVTVVRSAGATLRVASMLRTLALGITVLVGLNVLFALTIVAVNAAIPASVLRARVAAFVASREITSQDYVVDTATGLPTDRFSDCLALSLNVVGPLDRSPLQMLRDADVVGGNSPCGTLAKLHRDGDARLPVYDYFRYWHGYQVLTKPLMLVLNLPQMRELADIIYLLSIIAFFLVVMRGRSHPVDALFLSASFMLLTGAADEAGALVHNVALLTTFLGGIVVHRVALRHSLATTFVAALVAASCAGFVDLIYVPPLVAMVLAMATLSALIQSGQDDARTLARGFFAMLVAWGTGYLGTMALRVVVSALLLARPGEGLRDFIGELVFRLDGKVPWMTGGGFLTPALMNVKVVYDNAFLKFVAVGAVAIVVLRMARGWRFGRPRILGFFVLVAILPVPWYGTFRNHSEIHYWFTYVWASFGLTCAIAGLLSSLAPPGSAAPPVASLPHLGQQQQAGAGLSESVAKRLRYN